MVDGGCGGGGKTNYDISTTIATTEQLAKIIKVRGLPIISALMTSVSYRLYYKNGSFVIISCCRFDGEAIKPKKKKNIVILFILSQFAIIPYNRNKLKIPVFIFKRLLSTNNFNQKIFSSGKLLLKIEENPL